jgi:branched-chain amino acid transport system substrate-binding protein
MIATSQTAAITEELGHRYVFRSWSNSNSQIGPAALWVAKGKFKRIVTSGGDYEWGHANIDTILAFVRKHRTDFEVVKQVWPPYGTSDYGPYLSQIMAAKPDLIIAGHWGAETTNFIRQGKALGLLGKPDSPQLVIYMDQDSKEALGKEMPDGIGGYCAFHTRSIRNPWADWFDNTVHNRTGGWPGGIALGGYMSASWLVKAIEKAGTTNTEGVVKALEGLEMDTYVGKIRIRECDHQATGVQPLGFTKMTPDYPFCVMTDLYYPSGEQFLRSCKEIEALRTAKK